MSYTKHTWVNDEAPALDETNLNEMEGGIYDAHVTADAALPESTFTAHSIVKKDASGDPIALTIGEQTLLGRITAGVIAALTPAQVRTLLSIVSLPNTIANVLSDHNLAAHTALGLFDESSDVDHNATTNYAANQHVVLPNTIVAVLSDHNKAAHDALGLDHGTLSGKDDDDHTQYYNATRHTKAVHDALNINADQVDGKHLADLLEVAAGDFNAFAEKASPVNADIVLIEDSAASYAKKKVQLVNLPGGGGGSSTWLGLTDTPGAFDDGKIVKSGADALSFGILESDILKKDGSVPMTGNLNMNENYIDNLSCAKSSAYDYELNLLMNHGARIRPSLAGFINDLYLIVAQQNLANKPMAYFGVSSTGDGFVELGYRKWVTDAYVDQAWLQFVDKVIKPWEDNTHDFGASDRRFANIYGVNVKGIADDSLKIKGKTVDDAAIGDDKILVYKTTGTKLVYEAKPTGGGDVVGPASSVNERIVLFDGVTGKLIKDAGKLLSNTANNIPILDASALLPLAQIPATLTGKDADSVDGCDAGIATGKVFKIPASIAQGDIFYVDASGNIVRLVAGTNGHFLKTQGAGANPIWTSIPGGGDMLKSTYDPDENGVIASAQLDTGVFLKDGSRAMTGDLDMDTHEIFLKATDKSYYWEFGGARHLRINGVDGGADKHGTMGFRSHNGTSWYGFGDRYPRMNFELGVFDLGEMNINVGAINEETTDAGVRIQLKDQTFTKNLTFATTDAAAGKADTITSFPYNCIIRKINFRADMTAGQQTAVDALVNDATGLSPTDTSLAFDGKTGDFVNGNYYIFVGTGEVFKINDVDPNTSPITIVRGQKGTTAAYVDDNEQIVALNHGWTLDIFKDSDKKHKEKILSLEVLMTAKGMTDAAITADDKDIDLSADLKNVGKGDWVRITDTTSEEALVQYNTGDVANAANDFQLWVRDALAAHDTAKVVEKLCVYDIPVDYRSSGTTLYFTLQCMETNLAANADIDIEVEVDKLY